MKKKTNISILPLLLVSLFLVFAYSCTNADEEPSPDKSLNEKSTAVFNPDVTYGSMTDQDGNVYRTVTIGTQTWMAENLRATNYNDGTAIPNVTDNQEWAASTEGAYCNYNNTTDNETIATYGSLYNWHAINTGKLAPEGWHVPTDSEWSTLKQYLGELGAAYKLKETGTKHWSDPNDLSTNETGFTALPGGIRDQVGDFDRFTTFGSWWTSTEYDMHDAYSVSMYYYSNFDIDITPGAYVGRGWLHKEQGFSIRCIKD